MRKNYKLPKWIRRIVEAELQHYYGNLALLDEERNNIIEESPPPPDGGSKENIVGKPTEGKVLRMNSRKYIMIGIRFDAIKKVKDKLNKEDEQVFDLIYKDGYNAKRAEAEKGVSESIFYATKRKIQYLTAIELGYI